MSSRAFLLLVLGVGLGPTPVRGVVRHVPAEYGTINAALDASSLGDTVLVAPGVYTDSEVRDLGTGATWRSCAFMVDGVVLRSEGGPAVTTIDMAGAPGPQAVVINSRFNPSRLTTVEGFTVTGAPLSGRGAWVIGGLVTFRDCLFRDMNVGGSTGAGIAAASDVRIEGCEFVNCIAADLGGGGIYHVNGHLDLLDSVVRQCGSRGVYLSGDAGIPVESAWIENCRFVENWAIGSGGAIGISNYVYGVTIRGCVFERNVAHGVGGGAIAWGNYGPKVIEDCLFVGNWTDGDNGRGGAVKISDPPSCTISGCTFYGNWQTYPGYGGSAIALGTTATLERNVVARSAGHTAVRIDPGLTLTTSCNVYWANPQGIGVPLAPTDIEADPYFCDPDSGDFTVREDSPCLPKNSNGCGRIGALGVGCEGVAIRPDSWARTKNLYREGTRP